MRDEFPAREAGDRICRRSSLVFAIIGFMSTDTQEIIDRALSLPPADKALVVDKLLSSLDQPDEAIDALWRKEVEDRIRAYNEGTLKSVSLEEVLAKYRS